MDISDYYLRISLVRVKARFYHAMNLRGFAQYCNHHAVLSRSALMKTDSSYTRFWSDESDDSKQVLSRVFGNLYDFGAIYARAGQSATPNIYGPITLVFRSDIFNEMKDIVVTPKSIAMLPDPWRTHAISDPEIIDVMLSGDSFGETLSAQYQYAELSCENDAIRFSSLQKIRWCPSVSVIGL